MTRGKFNFQLVLKWRQPINISGLEYTKTVILQQGESKILFEMEKINEMIETLRACKRWLSNSH